MEQNKLDGLTKWVKQYYSSDFSIEKASSDASFRSYYRVISQDDTKIIMDAPPKHEPLTSFLDITKRLSTAGLNVPVIHEVDDSKGYILMSDLGKNIYLDALNKETVYCLYTDAIDALCHMQNLVSSDNLKKFDMEEQLIDINYSHINKSKELNDITNELKNHFSVSIGQITKGYGCVGVRACDEIPVIGPHFGSGRILISSGYMGNPIPMGLFAGKCLADIIATGSADLLPRDVSPERLRNLKRKS